MTARRHRHTTVLERLWAWLCDSPDRPGGHPMTRPALTLLAALAIVAGLWALIDTHADLIAATADGAHDWSEL